MFASTFIRKGEILPTIICIGIFYFLYLTIWFSTPSWNVNASTVRPCVWKSEGKAEPLFIFSPQTNFLKMTSTEKTCLSGNNSTNQATPTERNTVSIEAFTCANMPITAEKIIHEILSWDEPENIRENLHEMMLIFFMNFEDPTEEFKQRIYGTYTVLYKALKQIEKFNKQNIQDHRKLCSTILNQAI